MLLHSQRHIKLADFDRTVRAGDDLEAGTEPFARLLGEEGGQDRGTYGIAGPRTEQFAIGSVIYSLTRGHDPLEDEWWGREHGPVLINKFQKMEFPLLGASEIDQIIRDYWHERYVSVAQLLGKVDCLDYDQFGIFENQEQEAWERARVAECKAFMASGGMDELVTR